jgi:type I restriction enzyme S subunit
MNDADLLPGCMGDWIASIRSGVSVNSIDRPAGDGQVGVLKTSAVSSGLFKATESKQVVSADLGRVVEPVSGGAVLVSRMNTPELVGDSCYVDRDYPNLFLPDRLWQIRVDERRVDPRWFAFALQDPGLRGQIRSLASGTSGSMKNVSQASLMRVKLSIPSLDIQRRTAEVLTAVVRQIESAESLVKKLTLGHQGLLSDAFENDLKRWDGRMATLGELVDRDRPIVYGILMPGQNSPGGVPVVKVKDMKSGAIAADDLLLTSPSIDREYSRSRLKPNDILLSIRGTVGRVCVVPPSLDGANITQDTARISVPERLHRYVAHFLSSPGAQRFIAAETVGLAVRGINLRDVRRIIVPLVNDARTALISSSMDASRGAIIAETSRLEKLEGIKRGLLVDLIGAGCADRMGRA